MKAVKTKKRDRKATELALLNAASTLFAERGYECTRTLDIAKEAGVNEALILRYFGGKEGLLMAIFKDETFLKIMLESKMNVCREETLGKVFKRGASSAHVEMFADFFKSSGEQMDIKEPLMRIASSRALVDKEMAEVIFNKVIQNQTALLKERLQQYFADQNVKTKPEEMEALAILMSSVDYAVNFVMGRVYKLDSKKVDMALTLLSQSLGARFGGTTKLD